VDGDADSLHVERNRAMIFSGVLLYRASLVGCSYIGVDDVFKHSKYIVNCPF
jgi:hypothetical protein